MTIEEIKIYSSGTTGRVEIKEYRTIYFKFNWAGIITKLYFQPAGENDIDITPIVNPKLKKQIQSEFLKACNALN